MAGENCLINSERLRAFERDLGRWRAEPIEMSTQVEAVNENLDLASLRDLDRKLSGCLASLRSEAEELRAQLADRWPWNPIFHRASLLGALQGMQHEPILSRCLAALLDAGPEDSCGHRFRRHFLSSFLVKIGAFSSEEEVGSLSWEVRAEFPIESKKGLSSDRIDIVLLGKSQVQTCPPVVVAIEVKLRAPLGQRQLERYKQAIGDSFGGWGAAFVFLTPSGKSPDSGDWIAMSYSSVAECLAEALGSSEESMGSASLALPSLVLGDLISGERAGTRLWSSTIEDHELLTVIRLARAFFKERVLV